MTGMPAVIGRRPGRSVCNTPAAAAPTPSQTPRTDQAPAPLTTSSFSTLLLLLLLLLSSTQPCSTECTRAPLSHPSTQSQSSGHEHRVIRRRATKTATTTTRSAVTHRRERSLSIRTTVWTRCLPLVRGKVRQVRSSRRRRLLFLLRLQLLHSLRRRRHRGRGMILTGGGGLVSVATVAAARTGLLTKPISSMISYPVCHQGLVLTRGEPFPLHA